MIRKSLPEINFDGPEIGWVALEIKLANELAIVLISSKYNKVLFINRINFKATWIMYYYGSGQKPTPKLKKEKI